MAGTRASMDFDDDYDDDEVLDYDEDEDEDEEAFEMRRDKEREQYRKMDESMTRNYRKGTAKGRKKAIKIAQALVKEWGLDCDEIKYRACMILGNSKVWDYLYAAQQAVELADDLAWVSHDKRIVERAEAVLAGARTRRDELDPIDAVIFDYANDQRYTEPYARARATKQLKDIKRWLVQDEAAKELFVSDDRIADIVGRMGETIHNLSDFWKMGAELRFVLKGEKTPKTALEWPKGEYWAR